MRIIDALAKAEVFEIRMFGGEFTVFKHWSDIAQHAKEQGLFLSFVSNGYLLDEETVSKLATYEIVECNISLHGTERTHDEIVGKPGSFKRATHAIKLLQAKGISVSVAYTPLANQLDDLFLFASELTERFGVQSFGINRLFHDERYANLQECDYLKLLRVIEECHEKLGVHIYLVDSFPRCKVPMRYWKYLGYCSQGVGFAQVDFAGNVKHCSAVSQRIGNILHDDLPKIWKTNLSSFRALDHLPYSCKICPIFCGGGCSASRGIESDFTPDEFIALPQEETWLQAIGKTAYNRVRKHVYEVFHAPDTNSTPIIDMNCGRPRVTGRYKLRQEDETTHLAMFQRGGIKILTKQAADIIRQCNGTHTITEIASACELQESVVLNILDSLS